MVKQIKGSFRMKPVPGTDHYFVSEFGDVWSIKKGLPEKLKPHTTKKGYHTVSIHGKTRFIHRILMESFYYASELQVNHKDGNPSNNYIENLEYCTAKQNMQHAARTNLLERVEIDQETHALVKKHLNQGDLSIEDIAEIFELNHRVIRKIQRNKGIYIKRSDDFYY